MFIKLHENFGAETSETYFNMATVTKVLKSRQDSTFLIVGDEGCEITETPEEIMNLLKVAQYNATVYPVFGWTQPLTINSETQWKAIPQTHTSPNISGEGPKE